MSMNIPQPIFEQIINIQKMNNYIYNIESKIFTCEDHITDKICDKCGKISLLNETNIIKLGINFRNEFENVIINSTGWKVENIYSHLIDDSYIQSIKDHNTSSIIKRCCPELSKMILKNVEKYAEKNKLDEVFHIILNDISLKHGSILFFSMSSKIVCSVYHQGNDYYCILIKITNPGMNCAMPVNTRSLLNLKKEILKKWLKLIYEEYPYIYYYNNIESKFKNDIANQLNNHFLNNKVTVNNLYMALIHGKDNIKNTHDWNIVKPLMDGYLIFDTEIKEFYSNLQQQMEIDLFEIENTKDLNKSIQDYLSIPFCQCSK